MVDKWLIRDGMTVYSVEGHKLGKVVECGPSTFTIEKGLFFRKDYVARFEDVAGVTGDEVQLSRGREALLEEGTSSEESSSMGPGRGVETAPRAIGPRDRRQEVRAAGEDASEDLRRRQLDFEEGSPASFGEDPGALDPIRREPEE